MDNLYTKRLEEIRGAYLESKSWDEVVSTVVYRDCEVAQEAFIDLVEETYQTEAKDGKHLQSLTGITKATPEELEGMLREARVSRYNTALEEALRGGSTYSDLLRIKPEGFGLPKTWDSSPTYDQESSILWAVNSVFELDHPGGTLAMPYLRSIAEAIKAPYSVVMDATHLLD